MKGKRRICMICKKRKAALDRGDGYFCRKCHDRCQRMIKTIRIAFGLAPLSSILKKGSLQRKNLEEREAAERFLREQEQRWDDKRYHAAVRRKLHEMDLLGKK